MKQVLGLHPKSSKEVEAPPLITRTLTFSPGLKSGYSMVCFPLIKMQDNIHPQHQPHTLSPKSNCAPNAPLAITLLSGVEVPFLSRTIRYLVLNFVKHSSVFVGPI
jgi:hypothetical protein